MKYSAIKAILKQLHAAGWEKEWKGTRMYRKVWKRGELKYAQLITIETLIYANVPLKIILDEADDEARWAFDNYNRGVNRPD